MAAGFTLQLADQPIRPQPETPMRHHHNHRQMLHLGVELQEAKALGAQTVLEPRLAVHLHLLTAVRTPHRVDGLPP